MMKSNKEHEEALRTLFAPELNVLSVTNVNHDPHPYTIGPKHVTHAADNCSGMLGDATLAAIPCAVPGCQLSYEEHKADKVVMVQLTKNMTNEEARTAMLKGTGYMEENGIDGITLVETPEKFRITK